MTASRGRPAAESPPKATEGIVVRELRKRFGAVQALDDVGFDVERGQVVTLLGENGAGKSTLMRVLSTLLLPDSGTVTVAGHDVVSEPRAVRAAVGLALADDRSLYWRLTGPQNLEYFAALHGMRRRAALAQVDELIERVGLADAADRTVGTYSTGMRARLIVARALLGSPQVLLLDEPTRSLDPIASAEVRRIVLGLSRDKQLAILYATHDLHEAAEIGSGSLIISHGRIAAAAPAGVSPASLERLLMEAAG